MWATVYTTITNIIQHLMHLNFVYLKFDWRLAFGPLSWGCLHIFTRSTPAKALCTWTRLPLPVPGRCHCMVCSGTKKQLSCRRRVGLFGQSTRTIEQIKACNIMQAQGRRVVKILTSKLPPSQEITLVSLRDKVGDSHPRCVTEQHVWARICYCSTAPNCL